VTLTRATAFDYRGSFRSVNVGDYVQVYDDPCSLIGESKRVSGYIFKTGNQIPSLEFQVGAPDRVFSDAFSQMLGGGSGSVSQLQAAWVDYYNKDSTKALPRTEIDGLTIEASTGSFMGGTFKFVQDSGSVSDGVVTDVEIKVTYPWHDYDTIRISRTVPGQTKMGMGIELKRIVETSPGVYEGDISVFDISGNSYTTIT
jgi:hypothetical protein